MKIILVFLLIVSGIASAEMLDESISVNPYALPGDSDANHLMVPGVRLHEANDWAGNTDKNVTESGSLTVMGNYWKWFSSSLSYRGRYVTPVLKTKNHEPALPTPIGIHAEWVELMLNQSMTFYTDKGWGIKLDGGIGYNDMGNHSFVKAYKSVHESIGNPDESDKFGERVDTNFISSTFGGGIVIPMGQVNLLAAYKSMNSEAFREDAIEGSAILSVSEDLAFSVKASFIEQKRSNLFDLKQYRSQYYAGVRLFKFWTPSVMYVTPYLKGDKYGQLYVSPLSLTYPF